MYQQYMDNAPCICIIIVKKQINKVRKALPDLYEYGFDTAFNLTYQPDKCSIIEDD